jgi:hypothetical protein
MDSFIEYFTSPDVLATTGESNSKLNQVFLEMLKRHKETLTTAQYMDLYYFFNRLERGITFLKSKDVNTARCFFEKLDITDFEIDSEFRPYVEALNLYVQSYECYMTKDIQQACEYSKRSLETISQLNAQDAYYFLSCIDLNTRLLPILFLWEDAGSLAHKYSGYLVPFFADKTAISDKYGEVSQLSDADKRSWLFFILENLMYYANEHFKDTPDALDSFYLDMLDNLFQQIKVVPEANYEIYTGLMLAYDCLKAENAQDPGELLADNINAVKYCPEFLKQLLLKKYTDYLTQHAIDYSSHKNYSVFITALKSYKVVFDESFLSKSVAI